MKTLDRILSWLILAALVAVVAVQIVRTSNSKRQVADLPDLSLTEAQNAFPAAAEVKAVDTAYFQVQDADGALLGSILFSKPYSDDVKGFNGETPLMIVLDKDEKIVKVELLDNEETPNYLQHVMDAKFLDTWNGLTPEEALNKQVDAVSGATFSSTGVMNSLKARLAVYSRQEVTENNDHSNWWKDLIVLLIVAMALVCFFMPRATKTLRMITLLFSIIVIGFWRNFMLSLALFYSWLSNGISFPMQIVLIIIALLAIFLPLFTRRAFYCTYLCPMGALQEYAGKVCKKKVKLPKVLVTVLLIVRKLFLLTLLVLVAVGAGLDLANFEPFPAFNLHSIAIGSIVFAGIVVIASMFVTRAWCRFLCPTGLLLDLVRGLVPSKKSAERHVEEVEKSAD